MHRFHSTRHPVLVIATLAAAFAAASCSGEKEETVVKKQLAPDLVVRDGTIVSDVSAGADLDDVSKSIDVFEETVHPIAKKNCATGNCHGSSISPLFGTDDAAAAHSALIKAEKVDFQKPEDSRLVLRLSEDNHNCWSKFEKDAKTMEDAIREWVTQIEISDGSGSKLTNKTEPQTLENMAKANPETDNPEGTLAFEAEAGSLDKPFKKASDDMLDSGSYLTSDEGGTATNDPAEADANDDLGRASYTFRIEQAGTYTLFANMMANDDQSDSVFVRMDDSDLAIWDIATIDGSWAWDTGPQTYDLEAGLHTLDIVQREAGAGVDTFVVSSDPNIDPATIEPTPLSNDVLTYNLEKLLGEKGVFFSVRVREWDENSYIFSRPKIRSVFGKAVRVKDIKPVINGEFNPVHATFRAIDTTTESNEDQEEVVTILSESAMIVLKDKGAKEDKFSFSFEKLGFSEN